jgi:DNA-binding NarL/FixJ family response regulator
VGETLPVSIVALDPVLEAGIASTLAGCPEVTVIAAGESAQVAVLIVDQFGGAELEMLRAVRESAGRPPVVLVAGRLATGEALHALAAGARALLRRREADAPRLLRAVLAAARGDCTLPPDLLDELLNRAPDASAVPWAATALSDRERSVLRLVADGHETSEIAQHLAYSQRTVATVVHDITQRFRLRNRAHAVAYALRAGML